MKHITIIEDDNDPPDNETCLSSTTDKDTLQNKSTQNIKYIPENIDKTTINNTVHNILDNFYSTAHKRRKVEKSKELLKPIEKHQENPGRSQKRNY